MPFPQHKLQTCGARDIRPFVFDDQTFGTDLFARSPIWGVCVCLFVYCISLNESMFFVTQNDEPNTHTETGQKRTTNKRNFTISCLALCGDVCS